MAIGLSKAFETSQSATFTVSFPRVTSNALDFNSLLMDDKSRGGSAGSARRQVGVLIFPGVFKVTTGVRTCMVKVKVVCKDEMERLLERSR
ncbi:hypothetical protein K440DRAFT_623360 [Wilcoxina mikolae CBS 423.85]|nr:hypothetical protein K440DRAFT_623360 [Wilcoxina mikolae CBS 423.85]